MLFPAPYRAPKDIVSLAKSRLLSQAEKRQRRHDQGKKPVYFKVGDKVLVRNHELSSAEHNQIKKFFLLYKGPCTVTKLVNKNAYQVVEDSSNSSLGIQNIYNLKPYRFPID